MSDSQVDIRAYEEKIKKLHEENKKLKKHMNIIPSDAICIFKRDGIYIAVFHDFINLKKSSMGIGFDIEKALEDLLTMERKRTRARGGSLG